MKFVLFYHSFVSCWNHGNAHFLRGIARELINLGHDVVVFEPADGWSRLNALQDGGHSTLDEASRLVPLVEKRTYRLPDLDLDAALDGADVVLVHEWNDPELVASLGACRARGGRFQLLFHDTHHRAVTAPHELDGLDLDAYDGVLAFGEVLRQVYLDRGWGRQVYTWHEAADVALFYPIAAEKDVDLIWIGNWGDGERSAELQSYLMNPIVQLGIKARIHGVRYPDEIRNRLRGYGIDYCGWLPNYRAPEAFAHARLTVHVPRRPYAEALPGIPTIRVFEALACGIPLISAPWHDSEALFPTGSYLSVTSSEQMTAAIRMVLEDADARASLVRNGLQAIRDRHTCRHRALELLNILTALQAPSAVSQRPSRSRQVVMP